MTSNEGEISEQISHLQDRYGPAPVETEQPWEMPPDTFRALAERGRLASSYVWVRREREQFPTPPSPDAAATSPRVLFIYNRWDDHVWTVPGGGREPGESFEETARRELREATDTAGQKTSNEFRPSLGQISFRRQIRRR